MYSEIELKLTERQKRERNYYDTYAQKYSGKKSINFDPVISPLKGIERRPWNSYWRTFELAIDSFKKQNKLLDFGSGPGENALLFAEIGYSVTGFDISENNINSCRELFNRHNKDGSFMVSVAEKMPFLNEDFDTIVGIDILHHVDIEPALRECYRVLKPGGIAIFREPVEVPFLDKIRNLKLILKLIPNTKSFDSHITEDERKLNKNDIMLMKSIFPDVREEKFLFLSRFDKFFRSYLKDRPSILEKIDYFLMKSFPFLRRLGGGSIFILRK